ncbi:ribonuclease III [Magnetovibrio sp. PR-2]|uniref:ribonuclease III n=1 Tax=Magnetovibrio sp. PR-2 TaxID=3120356 RepID=UPI002FCE109E
MATDLDHLQDLLGHAFTNEDLLNQALRHASTTEQRTSSNERLEFLGDRVLGLVMAEMLYAQFPDEEEGELARRFAGLTSRDTLARVGDGFALANLVHTQSVDAETSARSHDSVVADTLEAVLGALYLDGGLDIAAAFIQTRWADLVTEDIKPPKDAKTALQEWAQGRALGLPKYDIVGRSGPDHAPTFTIQVSVKDSGAGEGQGASRRAAEQDAAAKLLAELEGQS